MRPNRTMFSPARFSSQELPGAIWRCIARGPNVATDEFFGAEEAGVAVGEVAVVGVRKEEVRVTAADRIEGEAFVGLVGSGGGGGERV